MKQNGRMRMETQEVQAEFAPEIVAKHFVRSNGLEAHNQSRQRHPTF